MRYYLLLMLLFSFGACKSTQNVHGKDWLKMKRTACFGTCPVYEVKIDNKGNVAFEGEKFVPLTGQKTFKLTEEDLVRLENLVQETNLLRYQNKYYKDNVTDLPTTYITYFEEGRKKEIMDYYGAPESLRTFEKKLQDIIFKYLQ